MMVSPESANVRTPDVFTARTLWAQSGRAGPVPRSRSGPVIRVILEQRPRAIQRLGDDDAHETVWQRQARQRPAVVRARNALGAQPVGPADEQADRRAALHPAFELHGEIFRRPR